MIIRSAKGANVNMGTLSEENSNAVALGNAKMNAHGDMVDRRGNITQKKEDIVQEYYKSSATVTHKISLKDAEALTPEQMMAKAKEMGVEVKVDPKRKPSRKISYDE